MGDRARREQLQAALTSRVVLEQANGMLAEYLRMSVDEAFQLLRNYARDRNLKLSEVASDVVNRKIPSVALVYPSLDAAVSAGSVLDEDAAG